MLPIDRQAVPRRPRRRRPEQGAARVVNVETVEVARVAMPDEVSAVGKPQVQRVGDAAPEIAGRIAQIGFRDGAAVAKALLVRLDAATQRAELAQARANEALARTNAQRTEDLLRRHFVSQRARDEAGAALAVAEAGGELLAARLRQTEIRAPFSGVVGIRNVSVGDYVKEGADLINLEDISTLKLDFRLPDIYLSKVRVGGSRSRCSAMRSPTDASPPVSTRSIRWSTRKDGR